jgi:hypothetical protein
MIVNVKVSFKPENGWDELQWMNWFQVLLENTEAIPKNAQLEISTKITYDQ